MRSRSHPLIAVSAAAVIGLIWTVLVPGPAAAAFPGGVGRIVYTSSPAEFADEAIWSMAANGTDRTPLTDFAGGFDIAPAWSPDGTQIAFARADMSQVHVWRMDADGSDEVDLGIGTKPVWSADGTKIAFHDFGVSGLQIWTMDADGSDRLQLTTPAGSYNPAWSPLGSRLAFELNGDIWTMKTDGSDQKKVASDGHAPTWSPDGGRIAFYRYTSDVTSDIFSVPAAGGGITDMSGPISGLPAQIYDPAYSPDGKRLAVTGGIPLGDEAFNDDIFTFAISGGSATDITPTSDVNEGDADWQAAPPYPFADIATSPFVDDILWLADSGITSGCSPLLFCPTQSVTRGQMASFLARALALPASATDYFTDDETSVHEADINRVRKAGITTGCTATTYCPTQTVTRAQMASFLARALALPAATTDYFTDDETSVHEADINRVRKAGITTGCTATTYCPVDPVTRGQMAAFLHRALVP